MSSGGKRPSEAINDAVTKLADQGAGLRNAELMQSVPSEAAGSSGEETVVYANPPPNPLPPLMTVPAPAAPVLFANQYGPEYFAARAAREATLIQNRALAMQAAANLPGGAGNYIPYIMRNSLGALRTRPLPIENDPLVNQLAIQQNDVASKIQALLPVLTIKQAAKINARMENITKVQKGKKRGQPKTPTQDQLQKVLFRALEFHASRRAAQLGAQARRARRERHALMNHQRGVAMADGTTVGLSRRYYKKRATSEIQRNADEQAKAEKKALRLQLTKINKDNRVAIARAHERKINPKDLQPAKN